MAQLDTRQFLIWNIIVFIGIQIIATVLGYWWIPATAIKVGPAFLLLVITAITMLPYIILDFTPHAGTTNAGQFWRQFFLVLGVIAINYTILFMFRDLVPSVFSVAIDQSKTAVMSVLGG